MKIASLAALVFTFLTPPAFAAEASAPLPGGAAYGPVFTVGQSNLQSVLDAVPAFAIVDAGGREIVVAERETLRVTKPVRLINLRARLAPGAERTDLIHVGAEDVVIEAFHLTGNHPTVEQSARASLLRIAASRFRVENGVVLDSTRHGIHVEPEKDHLRHGIVRNIFGRGNQRDTVSIAGQGHRGFLNWHILVEDIRSYDSALKGAVEVCDGNRHITVRRVYADGGQYGVDIQDHREEGQTNHDILVEDVHAVNVQVAVTTNARPLGHRNLTVRNVTGSAWAPRRGQRARVDIIHFDNVTLENIRVRDNEAGPAVGVRWGTGAFIRNLFVDGPGDPQESLVQLVDLSEVVLDGVIARRTTPSESPAVHVHYTDQSSGGRNLLVANIISPAAAPAVRLDRARESIPVTEYRVTAIPGVFEDRIAPRP